MSTTSVAAMKDELFPVKLHRILREADEMGLRHIISWRPDGKSFVIHDKAEVEKQIMPLYFSSAKFKSLQRSLNLWGFQRDKGIAKLSSGSGRFHPMFVRGRLDLCVNMRRDRVKQPGTRYIPPSSMAMKNDNQQNKRMADRSCQIEEKTLTHRRNNTITPLDQESLAPAVNQRNFLFSFPRRESALGFTVSNTTSQNQAHIPREDLASSLLSAQATVLANENRLAALLLGGRGKTNLIDNYHLSFPRTPPLGDVRAAVDRFWRNTPPLPPASMGTNSWILSHLLANRIPPR